MSQRGQVVEMSISVRMFIAVIKPHLAGDYRLPATPFDQVGPQAFVPGMRSPVRGN